MPTSAFNFLRAADLVLEARSSPVCLLYCCPGKIVTSWEWPQFPSSSQGRPWCKRPHTLWLSHNIGTGAHTGTHTSTQTDIQERISSEALDVLFKCSNRNEHCVHPQDPKTTIPAQLYHFSHCMTLGRSLPLPESQVHLQTTRGWLK